MAQAFNLTAQVNLQAPANLKTVVAQIRREFGTLSADVKLNISAQSARSIDNIRTRLDAMNASLVQARNNTAALDSALKSLASSLSSVQSNTSKVDSSFTKTSASVGQTAKNIKVATTEMEEFGKQSALAIRRFAAFSVVTSGVFALINAVNSGFKAFVEFDKELVKLQQVTGRGAIGLKNLEKEISNLSVTLGVSSQSLMSVASTLAQAGLSAEDTRVALAALAKTELAPSFDNLTDTTEGAIAAIRQFGLEAKDLEKALGSINAVAAAFAVESKDIIAAIQRTGGVFAASSRGVSEGTDALNEFIAVFTSVRQTTRESAETIATGLRTIFTRVQRAKTIEQLKEYGVELTDLEGKFVGPFEAVKRLSQALNQLDPRDLRFSSIVEELGGFRQIGKVIPLIQQFKVAQDALVVAQKGQGSLYDAQITAQKSLANQLAKVREQFLALIRDIGKSQSFQALFKIVTGLASGLISLASAFKPILPILAIMGAVKGVSAIRQFGSGFVGGLSRGGGARGVGSNIGETLSGAKDKEKEQATQQASGAIRDNTSALKVLTDSTNKLTSAVLRLTDKIGSSGGGAAGLNSGGVVRKFATGGLVPGSGNSDTVPAMLTPGEFVVRKKAVESLGSQNLHRLNKYASGGIVNERTIGVAVLDAKNEINGSDEYTINKGDFSKYATTTDRGKGLKYLPKGRGYTVIRETLDDKLKPLFNRAIDTGIVSGLEKSLEELGNEYKIPLPLSSNSAQAFLKGINDATRGNVFESMLTALSTDGNFDPNADPQAPFDYVGGFQGKLASSKLFQKIKGLNYIDAKASEEQSREKNIAPKILLQLFKENNSMSGVGTDIESRITELLQNATPNQSFSLDEIRSSVRGANSSTVQKLVEDGIIKKTGRYYQKLARGGVAKAPPDPALEAMRTKGPLATRVMKSLGGMISQFALGGRVYDLQKGTGLNNSEFDSLVKYGNTNDFTEKEFKDYLETYLQRKKAKKDLMMNTSQLLDVLRSGTRTPEPTQSQIDLARQLMGTPDSKYNPKYDNARRPFAKGGSVEDTVPALLTPGEFVINKKAAQKIGYAKLQKLNKADKIQGYNSGGYVGRFAKGGVVDSPGPVGISEKTLQSILRVLVAQEKNTRTTGGANLINQIEETIGKQASGTIKSSEAIVDVAAGIRKLAIESRRSGNNDRAQSLKRVFDSLNKLQQSRGGSSLVDATNTRIGLERRVSQTPRPQPVDQFSVFRKYQSGTRDSMGPRTPVPESMMQFTTSVKVATEAAVKAAEETEYLASRAKESGQTLDGFGKTLAIKAVEQADQIQKDQPGKKDTLRNLAIERRSGLVSAVKSGDKDAIENATRDAVVEFATKLREIDFTAAEDKINSAAEAFVDGLKNNDSLDKIFAQDNQNTGNVALKEIFNKTYTEAESLNESFKRLADSTGLNKDQLEKLTKTELKRQQFIQSETGQKYGKLAEVAPDMVSRFAGSRLGQRVSRASDVGENLFGKSLGLFGKTMGKIGSSLDKKFTAVGGSLVAFGAQLAIASDQLPNLIGAFGLQDSVAAAGIAGGIQGAGQGLASGALLGNQIAGPVGALVLGITGAVVKGISGAFDALNNKRLENTLKALDKTSSDLDIAFKKLENSFTEANFSNAQNALRQDVEVSGSLRDQAAFGAGGYGRGITETVRALDLSGLIRSWTGQGVEEEARKALVNQLGLQLQNAERMGAMQLNRTSTSSIDEFMSQLPELPDRRQGQTQEQYDTENKKAIDDRNMMLARANQTYQQLSNAGLSEDAIFEARYVDFASKQQGKTPDQISKDLSTPEGKKKALEIGKQQLAVDSELAIKQQILTRASRELATATDNLIDIYRRAQSGILRYSQELDRFEADAVIRANSLTGGATVRSVDRSNENALGNITAYSREEVERIANQTASIAGGGEAGETLKNNIITAKILQDELPKALRGAKDGDVDSVLNSLEEAFDTAGATMSEQVRTELRAKLQEKTQNRQGNLGLSDLAEDMSFIQDSIKLTDEALKTAQAIQKAYNDTLQASVNLLNEYNSNLDKSDEWNRKATDIRLNAELDLARALGKAPSVKELNKPFESEIRSLSSGLIPGGSTDPNAINAAMRNSVEQSRVIQSRIDENKNRIGDREAINNEIKKDQIALASHTRAINNGNKALEQLATNGEAASNALSAIQEREQLRDNAIGSIERILTSDPLELADYNRQLAAYTKTVSGNITARDAGNLQFRQDAFAGLSSLQGLMPDDIMKQMRAKTALEIIQAGPNSQEILNSTAGYSRNENGELVKMTVEQALKARAEGKVELDPAQKAMIDAYNAATQAQRQAALYLADNALLAAQELRVDIETLFAGIEDKLARILAEAKADAQPPKPEVEPPPPQDIPFATGESPNKPKPNNQSGENSKTLTSLGVLAVGAVAGLAGIFKLLPKRAKASILDKLPDGLGRPKKGTGSWADIDFSNMQTPEGVKGAKIPKGKAAAGLALALAAAAAISSFSRPASGAETSADDTDSTEPQKNAQQQQKTETTPLSSPSSPEDKIIETKEKEARSAILDGVQTVIGLAGLFPVLGEVADLANSAIYAARAGASSDTNVRNDLLVDSTLSAASAVPVGGWAASATQLGRTGVRAGRMAATAVGVGTELAVSQGAAAALEPFRPTPEVEPQTSSSVPELPMEGLPKPENYQQNYNNWKDKQAEASIMGDTTQVESSELDTIAAMAKQAMTPGSIYTHDTHAEAVLNKILLAITSTTSNIAKPVAQQLSSPQSPQQTAQTQVSTTPVPVVSAITSEDNQLKINNDTTKKEDAKEKAKAKSKKEVQARLEELQKKGVYRIGSSGLPTGRTQEEQAEYQQLQAQNLTPYQQAQKSKREAYLSRFRPEVRARMMNADEKAAERYANTNNISGKASATPNNDKLESIVGSEGAARAREQAVQVARGEFPSGGPIPTSVPTQQMSQQNNPQSPQNVTSGAGYSITLDETSRQFMDSFSQSLNQFGSYVKELASIHIPDQVTISGNYTVDLRISGAAALEALDKKIKDIGETLVSSTDFTSALNQLRDEVSAATKNAVKSSASRGNTGTTQQ